MTAKASGIRGSLLGSRFYSSVDESGGRFFRRCQFERVLLIDCF